MIENLPIFQTQIMANLHLRVKQHNYHIEIKYISVQFLLSNVLHHPQDYS